MGDELMYSGPDPGEQNQGDNLHVSGLARSITLQQLEDMFNAVAKVS